MIDFIIAMLLCYGITGTIVFTLFWLDTAEVRRLHKLSKEANRKKNK